jgi:hypothetical protein
VAEPVGDPSAVPVAEPRTPNVPARDRGAPRRGVRLTGGAGPEVREELVDHRRLRHERDEAHRAVAGRACERVDLEDLLEERRRRAFAIANNVPGEPGGKGAVVLGQPKRRPALHRRAAVTRSAAA